MYHVSHFSMYFSMYHVSLILLIKHKERNCFRLYIRAVSKSKLILDNTKCKFH